jgi:hypothetical protein
MRLLGVMERLLARWGRDGVPVQPLGKVFGRLNLRELPRHRLAWGTVEARSGRVAVQGPEVKSGYGGMGRLAVVGHSAIRALGWFGGPGGIAAQPFAPHVHPPLRSPGRLGRGNLHPPQRDCRVGLTASSQ